MHVYAPYSSDFFYSFYSMHLGSVGLTSFSTQGLSLVRIGVIDFTYHILNT